jgi:hypothetical protein
MGKKNTSANNAENNDFYVNTGKLKAVKNRYVCWIDIMGTIIRCALHLKNH